MSVVKRMSSFFGVNDACTSSSSSLSSSSSSASWLSNEPEHLWEELISLETTADSETHVAVEATGAANGGVGIGMIVEVANSMDAYGNKSIDKFEDGKAVIEWGTETADEIEDADEIATDSAVAAAKIFVAEGIVIARRPNVIDAQVQV